MKKILLLLLCMTTWPAIAQDIQNARQIFEAIKDGKGDSIYALCNQEIQIATTKDIFNTMFATLQTQVGAFQKVDNWKKQTINGTEVITADIFFEKMPLLFVIGFDKDSRIKGIQMKPRPIENTPSASAPGIREIPVRIVTTPYTLPGILCMPEEKKDIPVVILVHGSGPQDKDETVGANKPFRDLAYGLAREGIATLRYEKRTKAYGQQAIPSGQEVTLDNEVIEDVLSAVRLAKETADIDPKQIYVAGHSLGAMCAPRIAAQSQDIKGIILLAAPARPLEDVLLEQIEYTTNLAGPQQPNEQIETLKKQIANTKILGSKDFEPAIGLALGLPEAYWRDLHNYKQTDVARSLHCPILILQGERDYQVSMQDFDLWKKALQTNKNATFKSYPALNHLFLEGKGKSTPYEYYTASRIPDYVSQDIATWISQQKN